MFFFLSDFLYHFQKTKDGLPRPYNIHPQTPAIRSNTKTSPRTLLRSKRPIKHLVPLLAHTLASNKGAERAVLGVEHNTHIRGQEPASEPEPTATASKGGVRERDGRAAGVCGVQLCVDARVADDRAAPRGAHDLDGRAARGGGDGGHGGGGGLVEGGEDVDAGVLVGGEDLLLAVQGVEDRDGLCGEGPGVRDSELEFGRDGVDGEGVWGEAVGDDGGGDVLVCVESGEDGED